MIPDTLQLVDTKLLSLNVGKPRPYTYRGHEGFTSIFKTPVDDARTVSFTNIKGDEQADLTVHGGELKAVYAYDESYYQHWKKILKWGDWGYGLFGENLTTENLADDIILVGNVYQVGSVLLQAIQPRFPCFKLNIRFASNIMIQQFARQAKHGTYFKVLQPGTLQAGNNISLIEQSKHAISIQQLVDSYYSKGSDKAVLKQIVAIDVLPERLRQTFKNFIP